MKKKIFIGKNTTGEKYSPGKNIRGGKISRGKIFAGEKYSPGKNIRRRKIFAGEKYSPGKNIRRGKIFAGEKFRLPKISSLFPDEIFPEKVSLSN